MPTTIPKLMNCDSSVIKGYSYDPESAALYVKFPNEDVWRYTPLPVAGYQTFVAASSQGSYFIRNIRPILAGTKLDDYTEV